jgi:hypothetical protein
MKAQQQGQGQDHQQWQDPRLQSALAEADYAEWAKARDVDDSIHFAAWIETKEGTAWLASRTCKRPKWIKPRKEWTLEEFMISPEGKAWIEGCFEQIAGPSWID